MKVHVPWREHSIQVALGQRPADLVVTGGKLADVNTREIYAADVAIVDGRIAAVGDVGSAIGPDTVVVDASGAYLAPGFIDSHVHTESSGVTLTQLSRLILPRGVTTVMYAHEIANVLGVAGVDLVRQESHHIPLKVRFQVPTSVPWAPGLESPAVALTAEEVQDMLKWRESVSLGESDFFDVLAQDPAILSKIKVAHELGLPVNGHAATVSGAELTATVAGGFNDDHENYTPEEVLAKLRLGMKVMLRESNLPFIASAITQHPVDTRNVLLCTDDKLASVLQREGGVDQTIRLAVKNGIDPMTALQMATINAAQHFRLDMDMGSIAPGKIADIVVVDDLTSLQAREVIANGRLVAHAGRLLEPLLQYRYPAWSKATVHLRRPVEADDFVLRAPIAEGQVEARVLKLSYGGWMKHWETQQYPVHEGQVVATTVGNQNLIAAVERHGGAGGIAMGIIEGIGLRGGAFASTVSHDSHNITVVGTNPADMAACVNALAEIGGGFVAFESGKLLASVQLEIAGLISERPYEEVAASLEGFEETIRRRLGFSDTLTFVTFVFIALQSSPFAAAITDRGLIDVYARSIVPLITSDTSEVQNA